MEKNREYQRIVAQLKACGQSVIDNAETIVGGYRYQTDPLVVQITIEEMKAPEITVTQNFIPERLQGL